MRQLGVVIRVAQFVGGRLSRIHAAAPVEQDERTIIDERHAKCTADLSFAGLGIDPFFVQRTIHQASKAIAVSTKCTAHELHAFVPRNVAGGKRQRGHQVPPRHAIFVAVQLALHAQPSTKIGQRRMNR